VERPAASAAAASAAAASAVSAAASAAASAVSAATMASCSMTVGGSGSHFCTKNISTNTGNAQTRNCCLDEPFRMPRMMPSNFKVQVECCNDAMLQVEESLLKQKCDQQEETKMREENKKSRLEPKLAFEAESGHYSNHCLGD
jgi:hypothetical protein